jgi:hypothetical protein
MGRIVSTAVVCGCAAGCSLAVDADRQQCTDDDSCKARGKEFEDTVCVEHVCQALTPPDSGVDPPAGHKDGGDPKGDAEVIDETLWSCLNDPPVVSTAPGPFHVTFKLSDIAAPMVPPEGVTAQLCRKLDPECSQPIGPTVMSDSLGVVEFDVEKAFAGFATFTHSKYTSALYFFNPPINRDIGMMEAIAVQMIPPNIVAALAGTLHVMQDPNRGIILTNVVNCNGTAGVGVSFVADPPLMGATQYYSLNGVPNADAKMTDTAGYGGWVNVEPGSVGVSAVVVGTKYKFPPLSLYARPGTITYAKLAPIGH